MFKKSSIVVSIMIAVLVSAILTACGTPAPTPDTSELEIRAAEAEAAAAEAQAEAAALESELADAEKALEDAQKAAEESMTQPEETAAEEETPTEIDCSDLNVAAVVHWQGPYTQQLIEGARAAAEECGAHFQSAGPAGIDPPAHVSIFRDIIATGVDAVVNVAYPADMWVTVIDETVQAGVPVSTFDVASPSSLESIHAGPKEKDLGVMMANAMVDAVGEDAEGTVVAGLCFPGLDVIDIRFQGFKEVFADRAPGVEVLGPYDVTFDQAENFARWQELINANPDALAYAGFCEGDLPNLVRIKEDAGDAEYVIASIGINPDALDGIARGLALTAVGQKPFMQGYVTMRSMLDSLVHSQDVPRGWIDVGPEIVTSENVQVISERESSLGDGYEQTLEYYQPEIEEIFSDLPGHVQSYGDYVGD